MSKKNSPSANLPQSHLLPKPGPDGKVGSENNQLDENKVNYILQMRKALCKENIILDDGSLNLKYFNVKKGHYWSKNETKILQKSLLKYAPCQFKKIQTEYFQAWADSEIRLRICKLLRVHRIQDYKQKFDSI